LVGASASGEDLRDTGRGFGPFQHINIPIVGTDNYDFMMEGVANRVVGPDANIRAVRALADGRAGPALSLARESSLQEVV